MDFSERLGWHCWIVEHIIPWLLAFRRLVMRYDCSVVTITTVATRRSPSSAPGGCSGKTIETILTRARIPTTGHEGILFSRRCSPPRPPLGIISSHQLTRVAPRRG